MNTAEIRMAVNAQSLNIFNFTQNKGDMCYYVDSSLTKAEIKKIYNIGFEGTDYVSEKFLNGFGHSLLPVILDDNSETATSANWGLIPFWSKDRNIQKQTLNAKIETIAEKPSFRESINRRCLVLVKGFYEWKWLDDKGKQKHKHFLRLPDQDIMALGGIYSRWNDKVTGEELTTFSIVTTQANELMAQIHNTKHRMPVILPGRMQQEWLGERGIQDFAFPNHEAELIAVKLDEPFEPSTLF